VYRTNTHTVQELQTETKAAAEVIAGGMLRDTVVNIVVRLQRANEVEVFILNMCSHEDHINSP
jgi:hypothetical protein